MAMLFYSPPNSAQEFQWFPYFPTLCIFFFLFCYSNHPMQCNRFIQCTFDLNSPNKYWYYLLHASSISLNIHVQVVCLFCISCWMLRAFCTYWIIILDQIYNFQNVFSSTGCLFISLLVFSVHKIKKKFHEAQLVFSLLTLTLTSIKEIIAAESSIAKLSPHFLPRIQVSFELCFVSGTRWGLVSLYTWLFNLASRICGKSQIFSLNIGMVSKSNWTMCNEWSVLSL